jgi:signal peptidase II
LAGSFWEAGLQFKIDRKWYLFLAVTVVGVALDLFTKHLAASNLRVGVPVNVLGPYAQFLLVFNKAAIWGLDPRRILPWFPLNGFFFVFTTLAVVVVVAYFSSLKKTDVMMQWGISLIMPGALGNLWDRIMHAQLGVVDFVRLGISDTVYWAIFNMADVYVTFGVIIMLLNFILESRKRKLKDAPAGADGAPASG